ncbi:AAA family ATPase [Alkaliphilus serpentinus]|uniref:AAA family ATPase n=1 Tax=Alkaliphilus serpentinus TaxID=1482731 RepID=A0A833HL26_9FIRM|nr:AAA family ATPase [Alkaliphilus serpentinus]
MNRIHILGASGSGTTTLAERLSQEFSYNHLDTDNFFWVKTDPPFKHIREVSERIKLLGEKLDNVDKWVLSGSLCGWGDIFIPKFELVVFLWIPEEIRLNRILNREKRRYGEEINPGGKMYEQHLEFMEWASKYDLGDLDIRSKKLHEQWLNNLNCKVLRIEEDIEIEEKLQKVKDIISEDKY